MTVAVYASSQTTPINFTQSTSNAVVAQLRVPTTGTGKFVVLGKVGILPAPRFTVPGEIGVSASAEMRSSQTALDVTVPLFMPEGVSGLRLSLQGTLDLSGHNVSDIVEIVVFSTPGAQAVGAELIAIEVDALFGSLPLPG